MFDVSVVEVYRHAEVGQVLSEADMVGVTVGQHDCFDVADRAVCRFEPGHAIDDLCRLAGSGERILGQVSDP